MGKMMASMLSEARLQRIIASTLRECGAEVVTEKLTPDGKYIDLYLPRYDSAIELKTKGSQRKGVGQALQYNRYHDESCLLVPESERDPEVAQSCIDAGVGYGILRLEDWQLVIYSTYPFDFVTDSLVNAHREGEDIPLSMGALPEAFAEVNQ